MAWAPDYVTTEELAAYVRIGDDLDDVQLGLAIAAASRAVDRSTNRQFGLVSSPEARYYTAYYDQVHLRWKVEIDDLMTVVGLVVAFDSDADETYASAITEFGLRPVNAGAKDRAWTQLAITPTSDVLPDAREAGVKVTARWGWTEVPNAIKQATLLQASRVHARRDSPWGIAGSSENGSELRLMAKVDPDVDVALGDYKRRPCVAVFA